MQIVLAFATILLFLTLPLLMVLSNGVCCYDDASFALLAKNFANGMGYVQTINYLKPDFVAQAFPPALGQGPIGILPYALAIYFFGASSITPGLTHIAIEFGLLLLILNYLKVCFSITRVAQYLACSFLLIILISDIQTFWHWSAMLGESVTALLLLCGSLEWVSSEVSNKRVIKTAIFFSFAVLTKEIAVIFVIGFVLFILADEFVRTKSRKKERSFQMIFMMAIIGVSPLLLFELWRFLALGRSGFIQNWMQHYEFVRFRSAVPVDLTSFFVRSDQFKDAYHFHVVWFAILFFSSIILAFCKMMGKLLLIIQLTGLGILLFTIYWFFLSTGPARYLYIAMILWCFFICLPMLSGLAFHLKFAPFLIAVVLLAPSNYETIFVHSNRVYQHLLKFGRFKPNADEKQVLTYLDRIYPDQMSYTPWWAHIAALEYLSQRAGRFHGDAFLYASPGLPIVINWHENLVNQQNRKVMNAELAKNKCNQEFTAGTYSVYTCAFNSTQMLEVTPNENPRVNAECYGNIESINGAVKTSHLNLNSTQFVKIGGWLIGAVNAHESPEKIYLRLINKSKIYQLDTIQNTRPDIAEHYQQPELNMTGFAANFGLSQLHGDYLLSVVYVSKGIISSCPQFDLTISVDNP